MHFSTMGKGSYLQAVQPSLGYISEARGFGCLVKAKIMQSPSILVLFPSISCQMTQRKWQSQYLNPSSSPFSASNHFTLPCDIDNVSPFLFSEILVNSKVVSLTFQVLFVWKCSIYRNRIGKIMLCEISTRKLIIKAVR